MAIRNAIKMAADDKLVNSNKKVGLQNLSVSIFVLSIITHGVNMCFLDRTRVLDIILSM